MIKNFLGKANKFLKGLVDKLKSFFGKEYFNNQIVVWLIILGLFSNFINWLILVIFMRPVDFSIILHYNVYFGVDMVGNWRQLYTLPSIGFLIFIINFFLAYYFFENKERIAAYLSLMASLMVQMSLIIASVSVIIINY